MRRFSLLIVAAAIFGFSGAASACISPCDEEFNGLCDPEFNSYGECVSDFNVTWGPPGQVVKDSDETASASAQKRNEARKEDCEEFKGNNEEPS